MEGRKYKWIIGILPKYSLTAASTYAYIESRKNILEEGMAN